MCACAEAIFAYVDEMSALSIAGYRSARVSGADHLSTLCLLTDPYLLTEIGNRSLAPFDGLTSKRRARLGETLLAWLQSRSSAPDLATQLGVHPQTVRYRLRQLEELFGDRLNNPDERLNLEVTLRAEQLAATGVVFD
jgi:DNA-binding PucR family transcriptional regulator